MRCEVNQCQQCTSATDCPIPNDRYCSYTCENFSEVSGEANTCMLVCQGGGVPVRPPAMYMSVCARPPRSTAPLAPLAALFPLTSAAPLRRLSHRRSPVRPAAWPPPAARAPGVCFSAPSPPTSSAGRAARCCANSLRYDRNTVSFNTRVPTSTKQSMILRWVSLQEHSYS